jgi:hypothetical protein
MLYPIELQAHGSIVAEETMKTFFRILIGVLLAIPALPIVVGFFVITSPYWIIYGLVSLAGFVITGEWAWPETR